MILYSKNRRAHVRPSEGCYEHMSLLKSIIADARRSYKILFVTWLDLHNAFESIPHSTITTTLTHTLVPLPLIEMVTNSYSTATTQVRTPTVWLLIFHEVLSGVKQGCLLSQIIWPSTSLKSSTSSTSSKRLNSQSPILVLIKSKFLFPCLPTPMVLSSHPGKKDRLQTLLNAALSTATIFAYPFDLMCLHQSNLFE